MDDSLEVLPMTKAEAKRVTKAIQQTADDLWHLLRDAHDGRAWAVLGYDSWNAYVRAEFDMARQNAYRLVAQGQVIKAIEAAAPDAAVSRARDTRPPVSARQAPKAKKKLPEIVEAVSRGVDPAEAVQSAISEPVAVPAHLAARMDPKPSGYPWDGKRASLALTLVVDELVTKLNVGQVRSLLRDQDARIVSESSRVRGPQTPAKPDADVLAFCAHPKAAQTTGNGGIVKCARCGMIRGKDDVWRSP